jgi:uncharacterized membrane protein
MFSNVCNNCEYLKLGRMCIFCTPNGKIPLIKLYCSYYKRKNNKEILKVENGIKNITEQEMAKATAKGTVIGLLAVISILYSVYVLVYLLTPDTPEEQMYGYFKTQPPTPSGIPQFIREMKDILHK